MYIDHDYTNTCMLTYSGEFVDLANPKVSDIRLRDIAHALSNICRFHGQSEDFYSVAQHAVNCSLVVDERWALEALHHDDSEAYLNDIGRPLKGMLSEYRAIETAWGKKISEAFSLDMEDESCYNEIKRADNVVLLAEFRDLMHNSEEYLKNRGFQESPMVAKINPWSPKQAEAKYLLRHYELRERTQV